MPEVECQYLLDIFWEIGPALAGGFGAAPLTQTEIYAWQRNAGVALQPWEARFIRRLSHEYLAEMNRAEDPKCPAPWSREPTPDERAAVATSLMLSIRSMTEETPL